MEFFVAHVVECCGCSVKKKCKGLGRKQPWSARCPLPVFARRAWGKPARTADGHHQNTIKTQVYAVTDMGNAVDVNTQWELRRNGDSFNTVQFRNSTALLPTTCFGQEKTQLLATRQDWRISDNWWFSSSCTVEKLKLPTFQRNLVPPSSGQLNCFVWILNDTALNQLNKGITKSPSRPPSISLCIPV